MPKFDFNKVALELYIEITLQRWCSPLNLLHNFRIPLSRNTSGGLLLRLPPCQPILLASPTGHQYKI